MIGVYGCSNTGDTAMHAVSIRPPHLKAAFAGCFSGSKYDAMHRGGIYGWEPPWRARRFHRRSR
ncbi:MAG: hypothetical protein ACREUT_05175 [Steroidobacteraceae bacterium]